MRMGNRQVHRRRHPPAASCRSTPMAAVGYMHSGIAIFALQENVRQMRHRAALGIGRVISICPRRRHVLRWSAIILRTRVTLVIPGCAVRRRPRIHCAAKWITAFARCRPGMTAEIEPIAEGNPRDKITARQGHHRHRRRPASARGSRCSAPGRRQVVVNDPGVAADGAGSSAARPGSRRSKRGAVPAPESLAEASRDKIVKTRPIISAGSTSSTTPAFCAT